MSLSSLANSSALAALAALAATSCSGGEGAGCESLTVSNPAMGYFVSRLCPPDIEVNVMIPLGADHDTYTPRPSQMASLSHSTAYIAFGPLEFETTWRDRIMAAAPSLKWADASRGISLITTHSHHCHAAAADPHYWLSPKQAATMSRNVAEIIKTVTPRAAQFADSALIALLADVAQADSLMERAARAWPGQTFVVYHPALAYVARDYGLRQLSVATDGVAPQPRRFAELTDSAKAAGARVVFIQPGMTPDRVATTAEEIGAKVVSLTPEAADWPKTMATIADALSKR